jgi:hypothetical protein
MSESRGVTSAAVPPEAPVTSDVTSAWPTVGDAVWVWDEQTTNRRKKDTEPKYRTFEGAIYEIDAPTLTQCRCTPETCECTPFRVRLKKYVHTFWYGRHSIFRTKDAAVDDMHKHFN